VLDVEPDQRLFASRADVQAENRNDHDEQLSHAA
jgi:hypothetical protein